MNDVTKLLFECIKCELFGFEIKREYFEKVTDERWRDVYSLSKKHSISHLVGDFALKNSFLKSSDIKAKFSTQTAISFQQLLKQKTELERIRSLFEKEEIPFIVLKGPDLRLLYPEEWLRHSCDVDVLVQEENLERAKEKLEGELGYLSEGKNFHDVSMNSPSGVHLELHFSILQHVEKPDLILGKAWDFSHELFENSKERAFTKEFLVFYIIAHLNRHFIMGGCGIKSFIDLKLIFDKLSFDKYRLSLMLKKAELEKFFEKIMLLSNVWFGNASHDDVTVILEEYVLNGGVYGTVNNKVLMTQTKESKGKAVFKRVFMPYSLLRLRYPERNIKRWQTPYYQILRFIETVKNGRTGKSVAEIKTQVTTDKNEVDKIKKLMSELGLN